MATRAANSKESVMTQEQKVIRGKVGMLELARQLEIPTGFVDPP